MGSAIFVFLAAVGLHAQMPVAPTGESGSPKGTELGGYNVVNWFETGYRFYAVGGSLDRYRSDVNYGNGLRLLAGSVQLHSHNGNGLLFDDLEWNSLGLGNDPYQFTSLKVQKKRRYRYDMSWRQNDYFNPGVTISYGYHQLDTVDRQQDHALQLFPGSPFRLLGGFSRNTQEGPALTTMNVFSWGGNEWPLFENIRRTNDQYSVGYEATVWGITTGVTRAWEFLREDSGSSFLQPGSIQPGGTLVSYTRPMPVHGSTDHWRGYVVVDRKPFWAANGRIRYAGGHQHFLSDERYAASLRIGAPVMGAPPLVRETLITGNANRPSLAANLTVSLFPLSSLTVTNHTAVTNTRIDGQVHLSNLNAFGTEQSDFSFLGVRLFSSDTDAVYRPVPMLDLRAGYHQSQRRIQSMQDAGSAFNSQSNVLHAGIAGFVLRPARGLSISGSGELGRSSRPFTPVNGKNYDGFNGRAQYRNKRLLLGAVVSAEYAFNGDSLAAFTSRSRNYSGTASWNLFPSLSLDASYVKLHLTTHSDLDYFVIGRLIPDQSYYESNIHTRTIGTRWTRGRATLFVNYTHVRDRGGNQTVPTATSAFALYQAYPLTYETQLARLSIRLHRNISWNAGYQHYRYREPIRIEQAYRAHTGYSSLSWSF